MSNRKKSNELLENSPIANIALASKELFHSNFLAWVFGQYPTTLNALLSPAGLDQVQGGEGLDITREEQNLDLVVRIGDDRMLVIENKLKSLPELDQLDRYVKKGNKLGQGRGRIEYVLLTLSAKDYVNHDAENAQWKDVSYMELGEGLDEFMPPDLNTYHRSIVEDYASFVRELSRIADEEIDDVWNRPVSASGESEEQRDWIKQHKLHDLFGKRQGQVVAARVRAELEKKLNVQIEWQLKSPNIKPGQVMVYSAFTNSQPLVGVYCALPTFCWPDEPTTVGVGFQIQGSQFRSFIEWPKPGVLSQKPKDSELSSRAAAIAWELFTHPDCPKSFWSKEESAGRIDQCKFDTRFHYRYETL